MSDIHALSGAYAVDALDDLERAHFERHLADCADCQAEVASIREASAMLSETTATAPPPALRDAVLAGITNVRPLPPLTPPTQLEARRLRRFPALLAAAAAVVAFGVGTAVIVGDDDDAPPPSAFDRIVQADDVRRVSLELDGATATLYHSAEVGRAALETEDMPAAPRGKVYELWLIKDGQMVPAGLMPPGEDQEFILDGDATEATAAGITIEPAGGSTVPTSEPIVVFPLDKST